MRDIQDFLEEEEDFHSRSCRKLSRKERKQAQAMDRSKYKKTDQEKISPPTTKKNFPHAIRGHVLGIYPEGIQVLVDTTLYRCQIKGSLKQSKGPNKNLVTVGDFVLLEPNNENEGMICHVEPRRSILSRADNLLRRKNQLIAANIDLVIITACVVSPSLKPSLIDRYIIAARKGNMTPIVVINKIDLLSEQEEDKKFAVSCQKAYQKIGIPCILVSTVTGEGIPELKELMKENSSVFSGQSGTGKTSLINAVTNAALRTGKITGKTHKGSHTTTAAHLLPLEGGGFCVDTPGIRSFGIWDLSKEEIESHFPEIQKYAASCRFSGCSHRMEPECAVQKAAEEGKISPFRLMSYINLLEERAEKHQTR